MIAPAAAPIAPTTGNATVTATTSYSASGLSGTEYAQVSRTALATYDSAGQTASTVSQTSTANYVIDPFGGVPSGGSLYDSSWFGYYSYAPYPLVYEYYLGYEYVYPSGSGVYLYDYTSSHFWYTQSSYFPFIYDYSLNAFLYYYQANTPKRHFYDYGTTAVISE